MKIERDSQGKTRIAKGVTEAGQYAPDNAILKDNMSKIAKVAASIKEPVVTEEVINAGHQYEMDVRAVAADFAPKSGGRIKVLKTEGDAYGSTGIDVEMTLDGKPFNVEVKKDLNAQMSGSMMDYDYDTDWFIPKGSLSNLDEEILEKIMYMAGERKPAIQEYIEYVSNNDDTFEDNNEGYGVPLRTTIAARGKARSEGFLKAINHKVESDTSFIAHHYNKKGVYYIQIGDAGLFYLEENPLNLPVPKLEGKISIELRLGYSGNKLGPDGKHRAANIRVQGRMNCEVESPHEIGTEAGFRKLLSATKKS
jgi:hypothetical protein